MEKIFTFYKRCRAPNLILSEHWGGYSPGVKRSKRDADPEVHLMPRWRMTGAIILRSPYFFVPLAGTLLFKKKTKFSEQ